MYSNNEMLCNSEGIGVTHIGIDQPHRWNVEWDTQVKEDNKQYKYI